MTSSWATKIKKTNNCLVFTLEFAVFGIFNNVAIIDLQDWVVFVVVAVDWDEYFSLTCCFNLDNCDCTLIWGKGFWVAGGRFVCWFWLDSRRASDFLYSQKKIIFERRWIFFASSFFTIPPVPGNDEMTLKAVSLNFCEVAQFCWSSICAILCSYWSISESRFATISFFFLFKGKMFQWSLRLSRVSIRLTSSPSIRVNVLSSCFDWFKTGPKSVLVCDSYTAKSEENNVGFGIELCSSEFRKRIFVYV